MPGEVAVMVMLPLDRAAGLTVIVGSPSAIAMAFDTDAPVPGFETVRFSAEGGGFPIIRTRLDGRYLHTWPVSLLHLIAAVRLARSPIRSQSTWRSRLSWLMVTRW